MTRRNTSWHATIAPPSRKSFSMSRAVAFRSRRREHAGPSLRYRPASDRRDDPAVLVFASILLAAAAGITLLARAADHHLGLSADLHRGECGLFRACRRHPDRRRDLVGYPVPRPARILDLVPGGDVGAQSRQPDDEPVEADRIPDLADDHEPDPAGDRRHPDDAAGA